MFEMKFFASIIDSLVAIFKKCYRAVVFIVIGLVILYLTQLGVAFCLDGSEKLTQDFITTFFSGFVLYTVVYR
jgi:hypothetical protein